MNRTSISSARVPSAEAISPPRLRILLAEDDERLRNLLAFVFRSEGHEVVAVPDGGALLEEIAALVLDRHLRPFDLIVAEQRLPGIPGLSVLAGLRARHGTTAFILMTDDPAVQARADRLGGVVLKLPTNLRALQAAVRAVARG